MICNPDWPDRWPIAVAAAVCEDTAVNGSTEPLSGNSPVAVILLAAGGSSRMGGADKLWVDLGGEPLVARSLRTLGSLPGVAVLAIVAPAVRHDALRAITATLPKASSLAVRLVEGGARRQDSVAAGLAAVPENAWVLIHDAARPLVSADLAVRVLAAARAGGAAIPGVPIADTVKRVTGTGEAGAERVTATIDRSSLRAAQTPQAFEARLLRRAHALAASLDVVTGGVTDDAALVERLGVPVAVVPGEPQNLKVTTPGDLLVVRALIQSQADVESRPGAARDEGTAEGG